MKIYFFDTDKLTESDLKRGNTTLDSLRKSRVDNCDNASRKRMLIASDLLTRKMLSDYLNVAPSEIKFSHTSHGKPILHDGRADFNVSHSGSYWVGCVDKNSCGIDIEIIRNVNLNTAKRFCSPEEAKYIETHINPNVALLEIWTRKEAYFKSIGCGIATVLSAVNLLNQEKLTTKVYNEYIISLYGDGDIENIELLNL